jgi:hypothetical protein
MLQKRLQKWYLAAAIVPVVGIVAVLKYIYHINGLEVLPLSPLLPAMIAANVFLIGFLISGILLDYKEAERFPGELAASFGIVADELAIVYKTKPAQPVRDCLVLVHRTIVSLRNWFFRVEHTDDVMDRISDLAASLTAVSSIADANTIFLVKEQLASIRRTLIRVRTIRGTYFVPSGYAVAEATNILVIVGLLVTRIDTFYEAVFFLGLVTFLTTYMLMLLRQLDDPFNYSAKWQGSDEISLLPLMESEQRIAALVQDLDSQRQVEEADRPVVRPIGGKVNSQDAGA